MSTERMMPPRRHGRDHKLKGPDPASLSIDSTDNGLFQGVDQSVHSVGAGLGDVLRSNGDGTTSWEPLATASGYEVISELGVSVANGAAHNVSFSHVAGASLFDLSTPTAPVVITPGIYAVTVQVESTVGISSTGWVHAELHMDVSGVNFGCEKNEYPTGAARFVLFPLNSTGYLQSGAVLNGVITNNDGTNSVTFNYAASIFRIG